MIPVGLWARVKESSSLSGRSPVGFVRESVERMLLLADAERASDGSDELSRALFSLRTALRLVEQELSRRDAVLSPLSAASRARPTGKDIPP